MSGSLPAPCATWAARLAAQPGDLAPSDRAALQAHVASCAACSAVQAAYHDMDARILRLPIPQPLLGMPQSLLQLWVAEDQRASARGQTTGASPASRRIQYARRSQSEGWNGSMHTPPPTAPGQQAAARTRRAASTWVSGAVAAVVVALFATLLVLLPHGQHSAAGPHITATGTPTQPSPTATPIPAADLRAAYLGRDGHLHLVTLDGTQDTTGPALPGTTDISATYLAWADATASPDGRYVAYITGSDPNQGDGVAIVNIASGRARTVPLVCTDIVWSPDSTRLIADADGTNAMGAITVVNAATGTSARVAAHFNGAPVTIFRTLGWIDGSHVAVLQAAGKNDLTLSSVDLTSGNVRTITIVPSPPDVFLTPDGRQALIAPNVWDSGAEAINLATDKVTGLPRISSTFAGKLVNVDNRDMSQGGNWATAMAWRPGTHTLAISLAAWGPGVEGGPATAHQQAGVWLLDVDSDTARQITTDTYPLAWLPDGHSLLVSDLPATGSPFAAYGGRSVGPTLSILSPDAPSVHPVVLARSMVAFFGLVRAA